MDALEVTAVFRGTVYRKGDLKTVDHRYQVTIAGGTITETGAGRVFDIGLIEFRELCTAPHQAKYLFTVVGNTTKERLEGAIFAFLNN